MMVMLHMAGFADGLKHFCFNSFIYSIANQDTYLYFSHIVLWHVSCDLISASPYFGWLKS